MEEELITEEYLEEGIQGEIKKINNRLTKLRVKSKKAYKKNEINPDEYKRIKDFADSIDNKTMLYGAIDTRHVSGLQKAKIKTQLNQDLKDIQGMLGDKVLIQALKHIGCFATFGGLTMAAILAISSSIPVAAAAGIGSGVGLILTSLTKKIVNLFREGEVRTDMFKQRMDNNIESLQKSADLAHDVSMKQNIQNSDNKDLKENYFNY